MKNLSLKERGEQTRRRFGLDSTRGCSSQVSGRVCWEEFAGTCRSHPRVGRKDGPRNVRFLLRTEQSVDAFFNARATLESRGLGRWKTPKSRMVFAFAFGAALAELPTFS